MGFLPEVAAGGKAAARSHGGPAHRPRLCTPCVSMYF